jgi:hypothetical protein
MEESLWIACGVTMVFGTLFAIVFGFFAYLRYLRYKEVTRLAEKGLMYPQYDANGKGSLRWGSVITFLGIALCMGLYPIGWIASPGQFPLNFGPWMLVGLIPAFFGLALVVIYVITSRDKPANPAPPVPTPPPPPEPPAGE